MNAEWKWDWPKQRHLGANAGEKIPGDCWRCALAAILQIPADEVPHFLHEFPDGSLEADTQEWLNARGFVMVEGGTVGGWAGKTPLIPELVCGPTVRTKAIGQHHAVVMAGYNLLYDPHPDNCGLTYLAKRYRIFRLSTPAAPFH